MSQEIPPSKRPRDTSPSPHEDAAAFEIISTKRGGKKILHGGFDYIKKKKISDGREKFECSKRQRNGCYASLILSGGKIEIVKSEHTHEADATYIEALKVRDEIRQKALSTNDAPHVILQSVSKKLDVQIAGKIPNSDNMKRKIRDKRQKLNIGSCTDQASIIEMKRFFDDGTDFLIYDGFANGEEDEKNKMLIFGTLESLELLKSSKHWYADGTFDVAPDNFYQLYSLHAVRNNKVFPCLYALFTNKRQKMYEEFFSIVKENCEGFAPDSITFDFEMAALNAAKLAFPEALVHGCYFHLRKSIYRKIQSLGLQTKYGTNKVFNHQIKMFSCLAFVPIEDFDAALQALIKHTSFKDPSEIDFAQYFQKTYAGSQKRLPMFQREMWNVRYALDNNIPKTTNSVEGFHNRLKHAMKHQSHPPLNLLIDVLKAEYLLYDFERIQNDILGKEADDTTHKKLNNIMASYEMYSPAYYLQLLASVV